MAVYLDDREADLEGRTLGELLESAVRQLQSNGRMVVEVQLDGRTLTGDALTEQAAQTVSPEQELRLVSAAPGLVARQALEQVRQELLGQQPVLSDAAGKLQQDQAGAAFTLLGRINDVWLTTLQTIEQAARLLEVNLAELEVDGRQFSDCTNDLFAALQELRRQVQDQDTSALADALEYDWPGLIEQWDAVIGKLVDATK
ncbi:MAG: hypothetical protein IT445_00745 [Phycisphaeraceae bacterium]|nr:hypothetical protein [Phycisphaeraceae bacterium]